MGWLWATPSTTSSATNLSSSSRPSRPGPSQDSHATNLPTALTTSTSPPSSTTREDDAEVSKFIALFQEELAPKDKTPTSPAQLSSAPSTSSQSQPFSTHPTKAESPHGSYEVPLRSSVSESILPTSMSCRQAMDLALGCQSITGQFRHVYRYGTLRSCSEHWSDFMFCMRLKSYSEPVKVDMIRAHYREKEHRKYHAEGRRSSEDIWQTRDDIVPEGTFFTENVEHPTENDHEWRHNEMERRRKIRETMGFEDV